MRTDSDQAVAAGPSVDPGRWAGAFDELMGLVAGRFGRVEPRRRARAFVLGLVAGLSRVNCWTIAERAGDATPDGMQHLLARARWDADGVRDDVRGYVTGYLADPGAVLVIDETGDVKKGTATAGVARQYTGVTGQVENCQVAVFLSYACPAGHALIDRELYLPRCWTGDPARCRAAGIPDTAGFAAKPVLAGRMITRAAAAGVRFGWVAGDEVYGGSGLLRGWLEAGRISYVLAVARSHRVSTAGRTARCDELAAGLPRRAWHTLSAGDGAKGRRRYDWARIAIDDPEPGCRWLLIRRHRRTRDLAFFRCYAPGPVPLAALVTVAGTRWAVEEDFQAGKGLTGLDEHQVRRWDSWYRWTTLAMLAAAFLAITTAAERARAPAPDGQVPLTRNETARLLAVMTLTVHDLGYHLRWLTWRRRHQHRARTCHYHRHAAHDP